MTTFPRFNFFLAAVLALMALPWLRAVDPEPFKLPVSFSFKIAGGAGSAEIFDGTSNNTGYVFGPAESPVSVALLKPGKLYRMAFLAGGVTQYWLGLTAPSGYQVYIDGLPRDLVTRAAGDYFTDYYDVEIRPVTGAGFLDAGVFTGIDVGQAISWELGLGGLRSGHSVGRVFFREFDLLNNPASRQRLFYVPPINTWQVGVVYDGPSNQTLRQIASPRKILDFVDDPSGGYWIKYYNYDDATLTGGMYVFDGSDVPWKTIRVESPGFNQLKITETEGSSVRVSHLSLTSNSTTPATGGMLTHAGGYATHTFTSDGTFAVNTAISGADAVIVAGGGGGGREHAGGGGAGGLIALTGISIGTGSHGIMIGAGGAGSTSYPYTGTNGGDTTALGYTAVGGGAGTGMDQYGNDGGSGGADGNPSGGLRGGNGTAGQGNTGSRSMSSPGLNGGGGGGAGGPGLGKDGGLAVSTWAGVFAGGGGGGWAGGPGGGGGAGAGGGAGDVGGHATANTGSGGGGGGNLGAYGGNGGSGIVAIRYAVAAGGVDTGTYTWQLQEGDATTWLRTTTYASTKSGGTRENLITVRTGGTSGTIVSESKYVYATYGWGEDLSQVVVNPNGGSGNTLTTSYTYYDTAPTTGETYRGNYRRVKSVTGPTGAWTAYEYYDDFDRRGQLKYQYQPYLDSPSSISLDPVLGRVSYFEYAADSTGRCRRPSLVEEKIANVSVGKTVWTYDNSADSGPLRVKADVDSYRAGSSYLRIHTESIDFLSGDIDQSGEPCVVKNPDLSQTSWSRLEGLYNPSTHAFTTPVGERLHWRELKIQGSTNSSGAESQSGYDGQNFPAIYLVPNKSTVEITIRDVAGYAVRSETRVYTGNGNWSPPVSFVDSVYDVKCRLTSSTASNGAATHYTYVGGRVSGVVGGDGVETKYTYDGIGRTATVKKVGVSASGIHAAQADVTTTYDYDGASRVLSETLSATGTSETIVTGHSYDLAGRQLSVTPPKLSATGFGYNASARTQTTTAPDGGTTVQTAYLDGRVKQVEGTATIAQYYTYAVEGDGRQRTQVNVGTSASARLQKSWTDWLGRGIKTERPGFSVSSQAPIVEERLYDDTTGQLTKTTLTGYAPTLYEYNTLGQLVRTGLHIDSGVALASASNDRISKSDTVFESYTGSWWLKTTTTAYPFANTATAITTSITRQRLTGYPAGRLGEIQSTDAENNTTISVTDISGKLITTTTTVPGIATPRTEVVFNGLTSSSTGHDSLTAKVQYDALGRPWKATDARSLVTTTAYVTDTARQHSVTDSAGNVVSTVSYTTAGRTDWTQDALNHVTRFAYNARGQVTNQWGDAAIPVSYAYDPIYGERTGMSTYRSAPAGDYMAWPTSSIGTADTTTWAFDAATGQLWKKTDAASKAVEFDYNSRSQIHTRKWARNVTTTYAYDGATGELTGQSYTDGTPSVAYNYNRLGLTGTVNDYTGTRTFVYDAAKPWRLQNETLPSDFGGQSFTHRYAGSGMLGRYDGFQLGTAPASSSTLEQDYAYTTSGRFDSLTSQRASNSVSAAFQYGYTTNTPLLSGYTTGSNFAVARTYESNRNVLASLDSKWSTTSLTKYEFTTNANYQRKTAKQSGTAFADYYATGYTSIFNHYTYNARGELETAAMYRGDTVPAVTGSPASTDELPGRRFEYRYDSAGNRLNAGPTGNPANIDEQYTTNALNQYIAKENNVVRLTGTAAATASVAAAGGTTAAKKDRAWSIDLLPSNSTTAVTGTVTLYAALTGSTSVIKTDVSKTYFVPKAAQTFAYDDDGNMTADSVWDYSYDAENRLISMQHRTEVIGTGMITTANARRLEFKYDHVGRRVAKIVKNGWNGSSYTTTLSYAKFIYDGWNLVAEYTGASGTTLGTLVRSYTWGLDLTGDLTASGGVGALLQVYDVGTSKTYLPTYDGNGNVVSMVNASGGGLEAVYEYNPFGELIRNEGAYAAINPFRFSSKYTDLETGLSYYGHRYYSATLGRFINRDPIEEEGGVNLYGFCGNNGVNRYDVLGMDPPLLAPVIVSVSRWDLEHWADINYSRQLAYRNSLAWYYTGNQADDLQREADAADQARPGVDENTTNDAAFNSQNAAGEGLPVVLAPVAAHGTDAPNSGGHAYVFDFSDGRQAVLQGGVFNFAGQSQGSGTTAGDAILAGAFSAVYHDAPIQMGYDMTVGTFNNGRLHLDSSFTSFSNGDLTLGTLHGLAGVGTAVGMGLFLSPFGAAESETVLFGQRRIGAAFSTGEGVPSYLSGRPISAVAADLRSGVLTADQLPINAFRGANGELITINNRTLGALSEAGFQPTRINIVNPTRAELLRLTETPIINSPIPGPSIPVTPSMTNPTVLRVITVP